MNARNEVLDIYCISYNFVSYCWMQSQSFPLASRRFSTSILTPGSSDDDFPSNLLSRKALLTPERDIGMSEVLFLLILHKLSAVNITWLFAILYLWSGI